jgi:hypothetical protein
MFTKLTIFLLTAFILTNNVSFAMSPLIALCVSQGHCVRLINNISELGDINNNELLIIHLSAVLGA